jgi:death on curing protein
VKDAPEKTALGGWRWVNAEVVFAIHDRQLAEHGGLDGVRDKGAVESALSRPQNLVTYTEPEPDAAALAAAYAFGLARNHGFADGNKRTAWVIARLFLADNGCRLAFNATDAVKAMEAVASGSLGESQLADWFRQRIVAA